MYSRWLHFALLCQQSFQWNEQQQQKSLQIHIQLYVFSLNWPHANCNNSFFSLVSPSLDYYQIFCYFFQQRPMTLNSIIFELHFNGGKTVFFFRIIIFVIFISMDMDEKNFKLWTNIHYSFVHQFDYLYLNYALSMIRLL